MFIEPHKSEVIAAGTLVSVSVACGGNLIEMTMWIWLNYIALSAFVS